MSHIAALLCFPFAFNWALLQMLWHTGAGRTLSESETDLARRIGVRKPEKVRITVLPRLPFPLWFSPISPVAITLERLILVEESMSESPRLLAHELAHVHQYEQDGLGTFLYRYVQQCASIGYRNAPYELEARDAERHAVDPGTP